MSELTLGAREARDELLDASTISSMLQTFTCNQHAQNFYIFGSTCLYYSRISCTLLVLAGSLCDSDFGTVVLAIRLQVDSNLVRLMRAMRQYV